MNRSELAALEAAATPGPWVAGTAIEPADGGYWTGEDIIAVDELPVPDYPRGAPDGEAQRVSDWADTHCRGTIASTHNYFSIPDEQHDANQQLIAVARNVLPELLRRLDLAEQALAPLVAQMQRPGWCWACGYRPGHEARCRIAAAGRALASIRTPLDQPQETP